MHLYIVTGSSRGLGAALVEQLASPGNVVIGIARKLNPALKAEQWTLDLADPLPAAERLTTSHIMAETLHREARGIALQLAVEQRAESFHVLLVVGGRHHQWVRSRVSSFSSKGFSSASIASRARNIRERTVPIGQPMRIAISS